MDPAKDFKMVAEAWSILSKPELKLKYDLLRGKHLNSLQKNRYSIEVSSNNNDLGDFSNISVGFNTQKNNYSKVQVKASSNWEDLQTKYKSEKWQNTPLNIRKVPPLKLF